MVMNREWRRGVRMGGLSRGGRWWASGVIFGGVAPSASMSTQAGESELGGWHGLAACVDMAPLDEN